MAAQNEMLVYYKGKLLPAYYLDTNRPYVLIDGKHKNASYRKIDIRNAPSFGEGQVKVTVIEKELRRAESYNLTQKTDKILFNYVAEVTADRDLTFCYCILPYLVGGDPTAYYQSIGTLRKGEPEYVKIKTTEIVKAVGDLHIFSQGKEIRNDEIEFNSINAELMRLKKASTGVSVIALTNRRNSYPNLWSPNGNLLLTFRDYGTHTSLIIKELTRGKLLNELSIGKHSDSIHDMNWISPDEVIFVLGGYESSRGSKPWFSDLYGVINQLI